MPWLVALLGLSLAATPETDSAVVLIGRRTAVGAPMTRTLGTDVSTLLQSAGVPIAISPDAANQELTRISVKDSASCNAKRACLAELGRHLKAPYVVVLSVASIDQEYSVGLELLRVSDETVVETDSLLLPRKGKLTADQLSGFAKHVKDRLLPPPPVKVVDAPKVTTLTPREPEPSLPPPPPPPEPRSHAPSFVLGGTGLASLLAGGALLIVGAVARAPLTAGERAADGRVRSELTYADAQQLNASTTPLFIGGIGALAVGAGLGTAAVLTW